MRNIDKIAEYLAIKDRMTSKLKEPEDPEERVSERLAFLSDAREYDAMGFAIVDNQLVFTGQSLLDKFRQRR
jgi:hypothetical protein